ncbi:MAG: hypothetical protein ABMB14_32650, partial [Myxococcota bacterium]
MWMLGAVGVAFGGLGPMDVVVVYNAEDPDAVEVADAYRAARSVPAAQACGLTGIDPAVAQIDVPTFEASVRDPVEACLAALPDPDEIDAMVTVRGLPYVVTLPTYVVGLEAALQVGRGTGPAGEIFGTPQLDAAGYAQASVPNPAFVGGYCAPGDLALSNPYAGWYASTCALQALDLLPLGFDRRDPHATGSYDLTGSLFVVTRLDGFDHADALALIDRGVAADGAFPTAPVVCMAAADEARGARDPECELATRRLAEAGVPATWIAPYDPALSGIAVSAYFTGSADLRGAIDGVDYAPGAIVDNLTSYGAVPQNFVCDEATGTCPASESQTSIARFVRAGATGVHGTVAEPLNNPFPTAGALVLYTAGYTLGESYLYAEQFLYWQNLVLGDPLTAPFAHRPVVTIPATAPAGGVLTVAASHPDGVDGIAVYVDGVAVSTDGTWVVDAPEGTALEVMAVATAGATALDRPGWPLADGTQRARPETRGWATATVTVGPPADTTTGPPTGTTTTTATVDPT